MGILMKLLVVVFLLLGIATITQAANYESRGIGGGGAMSGFSMSPYANLWFVGTDMGTLFRSEDLGKSWDAISHSQTQYSYLLDHAAPVGFSSDGITVFHAYGGCFPQRSTDGGKTWEYIKTFWADLSGGDYYGCWDPVYDKRIQTWLGDSSNENIIFAGTTRGLYRSVDKGLTWKKILDVAEDSLGIFIDYSHSPNVVYYGTTSGIYKSADSGTTFLKIHSNTMHAFSGGYDETGGLTLTYIDNDTTACTEHHITSTAEHCGYVWVRRYEGSFEKTKQVGGDFVKMAENNSQMIYVTGSNHWHARPGDGTGVWVSTNAGSTWQQKFQQYVDEEPWYSWDPALFEKSAVAYDIGLHDDGYHSFAVNRRNASYAGGTENYFLHVSSDWGNHWSSPFTQFAGSGAPGPGKEWKSIGLEVTSTHVLKFHPTNSKLAYAGYSDLGGLVSEDGGNTWRITHVMNSIYDFAFDRSNDNLVYAATSSYHDWPHGGYRNVAINPATGDLQYNGGIYKSLDRGRTWQRLTPENREWNMPFLSVAYDKTHNILYGGTQGRGVARSFDGGVTWEWFNNGLGGSGLIVGQIELDPENADVYLILSGDAPTYSNKNRTGIYRLRYGSDSWELLRGNVHEPPHDSSENWDGALWNYPVHFAIDWTDPERNTMWLTDVRIPTKYLAEGVWKTHDGGQNWYQKYTMPDPARITIHPNDSNVVYISGMVDGSKFNEDPHSGAIYTTDGGTTWHENFEIPTYHILSDMTFDPNMPGKVFYSTFGAGMFYSDDPSGVPVIFSNESSQNTSTSSSSSPASGDTNTTSLLKSIITPYSLSGILVKSPEHPAVYLVQDGKRYVFPSEKIYYSWYQDFSTVQEIPLTQLSSYSIGGNITFKPGTVVKIPTDPKVYVVSSYGILRWLTSPQIAKQVVGESWEKSMKDLWVSSFQDYQVGDPIK